MENNPYSTLRKEAFWRTAVADCNQFEIKGLWKPRFQIDPKMKVATFGSCFAQHIGRALAANGFQWMDAEPGPRGLSVENRKRFNYGIFSARTGNIYTTALLYQWLAWAVGIADVPTEVWDHDGRFYDPFRPSIEPDGFASREELFQSRKITLKALNTIVQTCDVFVFTLGLTEAWVNNRKGYEYAVCPGTVAGSFDPSQHRFHNHDFTSIRSNLIEAVKLISERNHRARFLFTVSPVPLTATMSGEHVAVATMASKSILRAVAQDAISDPVSYLHHSFLDATWKIYGEVKKVSDGIRIALPSPNPFLGIKKQTEPVADGMIPLALKCKTDHAGILMVSVSSASASRKHGQTWKINLKSGLNQITMKLNAPPGTDRPWVWLDIGGIQDGVTFMDVKTEERIDYFPSYEIINSPIFGGNFFEPNRRNVSHYGVNFVMSHFFASLGKLASLGSAAPKELDEFEALCDEEMLDTKP